MNPSQPSFDFFGALNNFSPLFVNKPPMSDLELGDKFYQEGRYPRAYEHYKVHLEKVVNSQNPNIYDLAAAYKKAGMASLEAAKFADAHHFLTQALLVMEKIEDGEPYLFVEVLNKIGDAFLEEGKFIEAEKSFQDGFDSILKHYGDDHFSVAACFNRYGNLREKQQKHQEAIDYLKKAIEIGEKYLEDKAELAMSYNHLARVCACLKQFDDSFACIDKALQLNTELYGECHPEIARCYNTYGNALINQGKFTEALEYHRKSLNMAKEFLGEEHPRVAISYNNIGLLYFQLGQYDESLANYKMSCQIRGKCRIEYNPNALDTFFNVGVILEKQQKYKQALEFYKRALDVCIKIFGEDHIALSDCYCRIANLLKKEGNFTEAEIVCEKMMDIKKKHFGKDSIKVGMSYHCIGTVYHENKKYRKATECYINSYKIVSAQPTRDIEREAGCFHNISLVNTVFKDLKSMESMVSKSIKAYGSAFGKSSQQAQEANMRKRNIEKRRCLLDNNCDFNF